MIELDNGMYKGSVDPVGGWLVSFSDDEGDILFPRTMIEYLDGATKPRGGSHVCLPNFGPGGETGLVQHGFGRALKWQIEQQTNDSVTLLLRGGNEMYQYLASRLSYSLTQNGLRMELSLENTGNDMLPVAPGFHPYFRTRSSDTSVFIDGTEIKFNELSDMKLAESDGKDFWINNRRLRLSSPMKFWAHWTDRAGEYLCIEPTLRGNAFEDMSYSVLNSKASFKTYLDIDIL